LTVDDHVPCDRKLWEGKNVAQPKFTRPNGNELWVLLLEKAFAKLCGNYASLEGGDGIWALRAMTGEDGRHFFFDEKDDNNGQGRWTEWAFINDFDKKDKR